MNGKQSLDALELDDKVALHDEIQPEPSRHLNAVIYDRNVDISFEPHRSFSEFVREARALHRLEQPRPEGGMHRHGGPDDGVRERIPFQWHLCVLCASV